MYTRIRIYYSPFCCGVTFCQRHRYRNYCYHYLSLINRSIDCGMTNKHIIIIFGWNLHGLASGKGNIIDITIYARFIDSKRAKSNDRGCESCHPDYHIFLLRNNIDRALCIVSCSWPIVFESYLEFPFHKKGMPGWDDGHFIEVVYRNSRICQAMRLFYYGCKFGIIRRNDSNNTEASSSIHCICRPFRRQKHFFKSMKHRNADSSSLLQEH